MTCEYCQDTKFLAHIEDKYLCLTTIEVSRYEDVVQVVPCPHCRKEVLSRSTMFVPPVYNDCSFENYDVQSLFITDSQRYTCMKLQEYCHERKRYGFLLVGDSGTGKSHLLVSTLRVLSQQGLSSVFISEERLVEKIRSMTRGTKVDNSIINLFKDNNIIALSRLGISSSSWDRSIVSSFISLAYEEQRWILYIVSPYSHSTHPSLEERIELGTSGSVGIYSRLRALCPQIYTVRGQDYRHYKEKTI